MIRITLDLEVEHGNEEELIKALRNGALNKTLGNYVAYVTIPNLPNIKGQVKVTPLGGHAHEHSGNPIMPCDNCIGLAAMPVYKKYPKSA